MVVGAAGAAMAVESDPWWEGRHGSVFAPDALRGVLVGCVAAEPPLSSRVVVWLRVLSGLRLIWQEVAEFHASVKEKTDSAWARMPEGRFTMPS